MIRGYVVINRTDKRYHGIDMTWDETWPKVDDWNQKRHLLEITIPDSYSEPFISKELSNSIIEYYQWLNNPASPRNQFIYFSEDQVENFVDTHEGVIANFIGYDCAYLESNYLGGFSALLNETNSQLNTIKKQLNNFGLFDDLDFAQNFINLRTNLLEQNAEGLETAFLEFRMKPVKVYRLNVA